MSEQDARHAGPTMERIGAALDRIGRSGFSEIHDALAHGARHRLGIIKREVAPMVKARRLLGLADECERLADELEFKPEFYLYHRGGPTLRATFASANDAHVWQAGNTGRRWAEMFYITNRKGEKVTLKDQQHHPGHAYAILEALDRAEEAKRERG